MTLRQNGLGLGVALSFASACLTFGVPALAQGTEEDAAEDEQAAEEEASNDEEASDDEEASNDEEAFENEEASDDEEASPAEEASGGEAEAQAGVAGTSAEAAVVAPPPEPAAEPEREPAQGRITFADIDILPVTELPDSAYPSIQIRGITYGSLWRTFHGQQWPYMPQTGSEPSLSVGLSGGVWNDLSHTHISADPSLSGANVNDQTIRRTQTRGVFRVTPTLNPGGGWFAQGNAEFVALGDLTEDPTTGVVATTDDVWVRAGKWDLFDVTVGRFQGWEIANHYGMALDLNTLEREGAWIIGSSIPKPTDGYGLTYFWDRKNNLLGAYALHLYPTKYLRAELLAHAGAGNSVNVPKPVQTDFRPSVIFDCGFVKLKAGWEYGKVIPQDSEERSRESMNGYGFAAQFVLAPYVEFGGSFARGFQDVIDTKGLVNLAGSNTVQTVGGFLNVSPGHEPLVLGFGAYLKHFEDLRYDTGVGEHQNKVDTNDQWLTFGAIQYTLWTRLYVKAVVSHASNKVDHYNAGNYVNNALSGRLRLEVLF